MRLRLGARQDVEGQRSGEDDSAAEEQPGVRGEDSGSPDG